MLFILIQAFQSFLSLSLSQDWKKEEKLSDNLKKRVMSNGVTLHHLNK